MPIARYSPLPWAEMGIVQSAYVILFPANHVFLDHDGGEGVNLMWVLENGIVGRQPVLV
jgi:hypothetical protein